MSTFNELSEKERERARKIAVEIAMAAEAVSVRLEKTRNTRNNLDVTPALAIASYMVRNDHAR